MSQQIGYAAENQARQFLSQQGLTWITSNYRCRWGEIDLIMKDKDTIVFIEVRSRVSNEYGGAVESITMQKKKKIIKTASHYLVAKNLWDKCFTRFDVISLQGELNAMEWIKNAFTLNY